MAVAAPVAQPLELDPLVRGVLVYEIQPVGTFGDEIGGSDLAHEAEERDGSVDASRGNRRLIVSDW